MCFHGNQHPWAIKHPFNSLYFKYHSLNFICLPVMNSPRFPSLDDIYCTSQGFLPTAMKNQQLLHHRLKDWQTGVIRIRNSFTVSGENTINMQYGLIYILITKVLVYGSRSLIAGCLARIFAKTQPTSPNRDMDTGTPQ